MCHAEKLTDAGISGTQDTQLSDTGQGVLYGTFAIMGFFAGSINVSSSYVPFLVHADMPGLFAEYSRTTPHPLCRHDRLLTLHRVSLGIPGARDKMIPYPRRRSSWNQDVYLAIVIASPVANDLGCPAAALLWAAQGSLMMAYPLEKDKGSSFTVFWSIFQLSTLVGAVIALGIEANSTLPSVSTGVYVAFMVIMLTAIFTSWLLLPPRALRSNLRDKSCTELTVNHRLGGPWRRHLASP
jgi:hypothetical protein